MGIYEEIGLTKNESKVYQTLIKFGKLSAADVSAKSAVPYSRIYDTLSALEHKGLVEIVPEKTKKFIPSSPEIFLKLIDDKEKVLKDARQEVKEMKGFYEQKDKNPVIMGQGQRAFYSIIKEMKDGERYAYNIKWTAEPRADWLKNRKEHKKRGVVHKELVRYDGETKDNVAQWLKVEKNIRKIDNEGIALSILDDQEVMIALIKSNVTLLLRDKPFAKIMKLFFEAYYEKAEPLK